MTRWFAFLLAVTIGGAQSGPKTGSVEGLAINSVTKAPVAKATVTLFGASTKFQSSMITDAAGKFEFQGVPAGAGYSVSADASGFTQVGALRPRPFTVAVDQKVTGALATLLPAGVISGKVVDADGDPVFDAPVRLLEYSYESGARRLRQSLGAIADDRGQFRLSPLPPGRYYLLSGLGQGAPYPPGRMHRSGAELDYVPTFYPTAQDVSGATPIDVEPGAEAGGINVRLQKTHLFHARGRIAGFVPGTHATLSGGRCEAGGADTFIQVLNTKMSKDGTFDISRLAPGDYCFAVYVGQASDHKLVTVSDRDLDNLTFTPTANFKVKGKLEVEGTPIENWLGVEVTMIPQNGMVAAASRVQDDGSFVINAAQSTVYSLAFSRLPQNAYVKSIRVNDREASSGEVRLASGENTISVLLGTDTGQITSSPRWLNGEVAAGVVIVIVPTDHTSGRERIRSIVTDGQGNFTRSGLAPGDYLVFAFEDINVASMNSPEYQQAFTSMGSLITVHPNGSERVELKVISAEQVAEALKQLR